MKTKIPYRVLLSLLAGVFALRVAAQFWQQDGAIALLPAFDLWHSETMPYSALLGAQFAILAFMGAAIMAIPLQLPRPKLGTAVIAVGWSYVGLMTVRLIVGAFNLSEHSWFDGAVSTAFHFGLAAFLLVFGSALKGDQREHSRLIVKKWSRYIAYPLLVTGACILFVWLRDTGSPLLFSSYLSVLIGGFGVLLHESFSPARDDWRPTSHDVAHDSLFLSLVQVALPAILKALTLAAILAVAQSDIAPFASLWPHETSILAQVIAMLIIAEFFRYWLHRALHEIGPLWKLHAVHHSSTKLYTVNVGRFHPLDKSLQFAGDTLPFLLLGVSPEVFAAYFVFYAVNGFYQHSNADVRLGPLNWVIAGPELHRWHHSVLYAEANSNYGNNLIIWDTIFGTRFLRKRDCVNCVGIGNPIWPDGFLAQMVAPFSVPTDAANG